MGVGVLVDIPAGGGHRSGLNSVSSVQHPVSTHSAGVTGAQPYPVFIWVTETQSLLLEQQVLLPMESGKEKQSQAC